MDRVGPSRMDRVEQADSSGDGTPRRRKSTSKGGDAGKKATNPESNEEVLSDTPHPCPKGFPCSMPRPWVPPSPSPESQQLDLGLGISGEELLRNSTHWQGASPLPAPTLWSTAPKSFPKTGEGIRPTSGKADTSTCPLSPRLQKGGRQKEGARGALRFSVDH